MNKVLISIILFTSTLLHAESVTCTSEISRVGYHQPNGLYIKLVNTGIMKVCSPDETFFRTGSESCKVIASLAMTAKTTGKKLTIVIDNAPSTTCSDIENWFFADIRFVELVDQ